MQTTESHLNSAISHLDELAANSSNLDKQLNRKEWEAIKKARKLLLEVAEIVEAQ